MVSSRGGDSFRLGLGGRAAGFNLGIIWGGGVDQIMSFLAPFFVLSGHMAAYGVESKMTATCW